MNSSLKQNQNRTGKRVGRRGAVLVVAMICALLTAIILGTLLQLTVTRSKMSKQHERALQAQWLAEAGIERAAAQLASDPAYTGETWRVTTAELAGHFEGEVLIEVQSAPDQEQQRTIVAVADYPVDAPWRIRQRNKSNFI